MKRKILFSIGSFAAVAFFFIVILDSHNPLWGWQRRTASGFSEGIPADLFSHAGRCVKCHDNITDLEGKDVSFVHNWSSSMMRFSFIDPFWRAKVWSESDRNPALAGVIQKKCARCHAGMASESAIRNEDTVYIFDNGFTDEKNSYHEAAMEGVGCTLCHKITDDFYTDDHPFSGNYQIFDLQVATGPFDADFVDAMEGYSACLPLQVDYLATSEFCATCHDLHTAYYDAETGGIVSTDDTLFPEQTPYREWKASSFFQEGTQCQGCHMTAAALTKMAVVPEQTRERQGVMNHTFFSQNTTMLGIIESVTAEMGLETPDLSDAVTAGQAYLSSAGKIEIQSCSFKENVLKVQVRVSNNTGHKLPTGIPLRRAFIHFTVSDQNGDILFSSGETDDQGRIIGVNADTDPTTFEPHHEVISIQDQVQVYEGVMADVHETPTYTLLQSSHFIKDNRLLPLLRDGINKINLDPKILPTGDAMADDNFTGGEDLVTYRIEKNLPDTVIVKAELKYQSISYPMAADLLAGLQDDDSDDSDDPEDPIQFFKSRYESHKANFETIHEDFLTLYKE